MDVRSRCAGVVVALVACLVLAGCGGGEGVRGGGAGSVSTAATVTFAERKAGMDAAETKLKQLWNSGTTVSQNRALATYMAGLPQFTQAVAIGANDGGGVIAAFRDGQVYVVCNDGTAPSTASAAEQAAGAMDTVAVRSGVPRGKTAILMRAMGTGWTDIRGDLKAMLTKAGYNVSLRDGSIENIRSLPRADVLYLDTHGDYSDGDIAGATIASAWTTTPVTSANDATYAGELAGGANASLVRWSAKGHKDATGKWVIEKRYAITAEFIRKNGIAFKANSLVYMDCCYLDAAPFRSACLDAGASLYVGWTAPVGGTTSARAARFVFDRLTGANSSATTKEDPLQRPFDYLAVWNDLEGRGWNTSGTALINFTPGKGDGGMLAPSIHHVEIGEATELSVGISTMEIKGLFGRDPGATKRKVTVGGTMVPAYRWQGDSISCTIPRFGAGSVGDVVVQVGEHKSNAVPLTEWQVPFTYTHTSFGNLKDVLHLNIHFRADVHSYRNKPGKPPIEPKAVKFLSMVDSDGNWKSTGSGTDSTDPENPIKHAWSGSGLLFNQTPLPGATTLEVVRASGTINVSTRTIQFTVSGDGAPKTIDNWDKDDYHWQTTGEAANTDGRPYDGLNGRGVPYVNVRFDENFGILARTVTGTLPGHPEATVTLKWAAAAASFAPLPDMTPSSVARLLDLFPVPAA